jgi:hypothetical protein
MRNMFCVLANLTHVYMYPSPIAGALMSLLTPIFW